MDIQGSEKNLFREVISYLKRGLIHNVVMATHSEALHKIIVNEIGVLNKSFIIEDSPYIKGVGDGEIIIKRKYL